MADWERVREEFPALREWVYLNTATFGQMPRAGFQAMEAHQRRREQFACSDFLSWFDDADQIRAQVGKLIGATAEDIAFIPNAATAISLLVGSVDWKPGERFVTLAHEFPNHLYQRALFEEKGVQYVETTWEQLPGYLDGRTRVVAVSSINYMTGFCPDVAAIAKAVREAGALLYVDGTQGLGALCFDVRRVEPAMYAVNGYKWLLSPPGAAFMYVDKELRARLRPAVVGWRSHHDWRSVEHLHHGSPEFSPAAERYEGGMLAFAPLYAMGAAVELMLKLGAPQIEERVLALTERAREQLRAADASIEGDGRADYRSPILAARFRGVDAGELSRQLRERKIVVSARHGNLRVSLHFYNNEEDVERLGAELRKLL